MHLTVKKTNQLPFSHLPSKLFEDYLTMWKLKNQLIS